MAFNYARARQTAEKLIKASGRKITLVNDSGLADPMNPLGPPAAPVEVPDIIGTFVRPSGYIKLGESFYMEQGMWEEAEKICLVLPSLVHDFSKFTRVIDTDGMGYKIFKVEELKPGDVPILVYLGLKQ